MPAPDDLDQRRHREVGRAHEDEAEGHCYAAEREGIHEFESDVGKVRFVSCRNCRAVCESNSSNHRVHESHWPARPFAFCSQAAELRSSRSIKSKYASAIAYILQMVDGGPQEVTT